MTSPPDLVRQLMESTDQSAWSAAALVLALQGTAVPGMREAAAEVLSAHGIRLAAGTEGLDRQGAAAEAAAPLLQTAALLSGQALSWAEQPDEALLAQGRASAQGAAMFAKLGVPQLTGLAEALALPGARMLDVGTGTGALAVAYAEQFPAVTVVGIDVLPRVLALAAETVAASSVADRVELRHQDLAAIDDEEAFAVAWLPTPFVPEPALRAGLPRLWRSLTPGGWVLLAHGKFSDDPLDNALTRFKTVAYGGTSLDDEQARRLLTEVGFTSVGPLPTPPGAPAITLGRR